MLSKSVKYPFHKNKINKCISDKITLSMCVKWDSDIAYFNYTNTKDRRCIREKRSKKHSNGYFHFFKMDGIMCIIKQNDKLE